MSDRGTIYGVRHKPYGVICYVGQTRRKPQKRWLEHKNGAGPLAKTLRALAPAETWDFFVIEEVAVADLDAREVYWIEHHSTSYPRGFNRREGGLSWTDKTRALLSEKVKQLFSAPKFREWRSVASKQMWADEQKRANIQQGLVEGWKCETRKGQHRAKMKAVMSDPDRRARISASMKAYRARVKEESDVCSAC